MPDSFLDSMIGRSSRFARSRLIFGAFLISFSGVWVKICHVAPTASAFYRALFGGLFLLGAVLLKHEIRRSSRRHLLLGLLCGFLFAVDLICYHYSIHFVGPGLGTILPNFQVFILAGIGAVILGEKVRIATVISMPIAITGLFLIVGIDVAALDRHYRAGIYFGLGAAVVYSLFLLSLRKLQAEQSGRSIFYVLMMVSLISALLIAMELLRTETGFTIPDGQSFWSLLALGLFSQAIGWVLITNALPFVRVSLSGLILLLQPSLAFVWDVFFFQRPTSAFNWLGVAIVLAAIYAAATGGIRRGDIYRSPTDDIGG